MSLLITNTSVLHVVADGSEVTVLESQEIVIEGNQITAVQPTGTANPTEFTDVIDAGGKLAMPGLINCHAHVPMVLWRGLAEDASIDRWFNDLMWPLENNLEPEDVYWGMLLGLIEQIEAGVTAVADHYFHLEHAVRAVTEAGTRALLGYAMFGSQGMTKIEETAAFVEEFRGAADGRIRTIMAPHAPYTCEPDFLRATADVAAQVGVGIHIHVSETREQTIGSLRRYGKTPVQILEETGVLNVPTILAHVTGATSDDINILAEYDAGIAQAVKTYMKLGKDVGPVLEFDAAGISLGIATDGVVSNSTLNLWETMRLLALSQKSRAQIGEVMPIPKTLAIATHGSAKVYGLPDDIGAVEAGRLADIILIDLSETHHQPLYNVGMSLVYNMQPTDVKTVIVDGRVIMRDRELLTIDKQRVFTEVRSRMERLSYIKPENRIQTYSV
ncbi:MAG: amidohydrolase [Chloroflexota bacterium]